MVSTKDKALAEALAVRSPSDNLPLWLEVARRHAAKRSPADLLAQMDRDPFVQLGGLDLRTLHLFDGAALEAAEGFDAVLLSPLAPLGACSVVSPTVQDRAVVTARGTEVVSDPTNVMAIACARRVAREPGREVRMATIHQVVRPQRFGAKKGYTQHFRMFALAHAGRARAEHGFEVDAILGLLGVFVRLVDTCTMHGCRFGARRATLFAGERPSDRAIAERVRARIAQMKDLALEEAPLASTYYAGVRVLFNASTLSGDDVQLGDVGLFDWVAKLTSNNKMRFAAAGFGLPLLPLLFR